MADLKTTPNEQSVEEFLNGVADDEKRRDCFALLELMTRITEAEPTMWGGSIVGFGSYHYRYESGREGDWFLTGFSPRKQSLTVYVMAGFEGYPDLMKKLGKHKTGKSCLYINRLADVDLPTLEALVRASVEHTRRTYA